MADQQRSISEWRVVRGMTQQQLADAIGAKTQQVSQWETGQRGISARRLQDVARALRVSMDDIELPEQREATKRKRIALPGDEDAE